LRWKGVFSFYGSKSKITQHYPEPKHDLIIEPFAGGGSYSFRHARAGSGRTAWLNDLDERVASIWEFLLSRDAAGWVSNHWPATVTAGRGPTDYLPVNSPAGFIELFRSEANQGTQGARGVHNQITSMGEKCWPRTRVKLLEIIPLISHWKFTRRNYDQLANVEATWFIDPPYNNLAGHRYRTGDGLDYSSLARYCRERMGQTIVCENAGATWLEFKPLNVSARGIKSRYQKANAKEVIWTNDHA
jgi:site-specific DNA-adenine methylase